MKKTMFSMLVAMMVVSGVGESAMAQNKPTISKTDPITGLTSAEWMTMVGNILEGQSLIGIDGVLMINPLPTPVTVTCDRWTLVGPNPYIKANPAALKPFSVTFVQTKGFDGYCKSGVVGHSGVRSLTAKLDAANGSFSESTIITFGADQ